MTCRDVALATALGAAVVVGLPPPAVFAQATDTGSPPATTPPQAPDAEHATEPPPPPDPENRANRPLADPIAERIKYLHDRLHITPAQEPLWAKVAAVMRENAKTVAPLIKDRVQSAQHGSAIETLNSYEKLGQAQLDDLKKFIDAFQALYNGLSASQKKIADGVFRLGPLAMVGGIPEPAEALMAPGPNEYAPPYSAYAGVPPPYYPGYAYAPSYAYTAPPYGYYPGFSGAPIAVSPFFFHRHFFHGPFFHGFHTHIHAFHHR
jgi:periplasmic protein CpxP/Spy